MLFDPKWNQPSVAGFKAWLEKQPRDKTFEYLCFQGCALDQYLKTLGTSWEELNDSRPSLLHKLDHFPYMVAAQETGRLPTFGDVLAEIEKAGQ